MMMVSRKFEINWRIKLDNREPIPSHRDLHDSIGRCDVFKNRSDIQTFGTGSRFKVLTLFFESKFEANKFMENLEFTNTRLCGRGLLIDLHRADDVCTFWNLMTFFFFNFVFLFCFF